MAVPTGDTYAADGQGHLTMSIGDLHALAAHTLPDKIEELVNALGKIADALQNLKISWTGPSKTEAQQLLDRWTDVSNSIFGTQNDPAKGVLARIAGGVENAAFTYNQAEIQIQQVWAKLNDELLTLLSGAPLADNGQGSDTPPISEI